MKQVFDNNLQITEGIRRLINAIKPMLGEATIQQKAKFVELLSEAKKVMVNEKAGDVYSERQSDIIKDLGNGYFLGDDSYDDDEGFTKAGYSVYYQEGPDQFRHVDYVEMSPYRNEPGAIDASIQQIIDADSRVEKVTESADYLEEK